MTGGEEEDRPQLGKGLGAMGGGGETLESSAAHHSFGSVKATPHTFSQHTAQRPCPPPASSQPPPCTYDTSYLSPPLPPLPPAPMI